MTGFRTAAGEPISRQTGLTLASVDLAYFLGCALPVEVRRAHRRWLAGVEPQPS